ncbi:DUF362 domain-containing protein [SAR202 cluster bacterium AD-802-K11_MRT_200m]|nr:DUF362 domain-containing protein [SAR202 cluster bacterium AD-802-K11_MRT_200m]
MVDDSAVDLLDGESRPVSSPDSTEIQSNPVVAVVRTSPETVLNDIKVAMNLGGYTSVLQHDLATLLKINISWQHYYPACSTSPWQLDGVIRALAEDGYQNIIPTHNGTVVVDAKEGQVKNGHKFVEDLHDLSAIHLEEQKWIPFESKEKYLVLDKIYKQGIYIPEVLIGKNVVHLPTMKTHVFTTITGAMKNAFGGLLNFQRHWTHSVIHETLVDLLRIQKQIHPGIFAVTDGTFAGSGAGPRAMEWHEKNVILAGADQVAVDAVSASMMGFDPMSIEFIRLAHEEGLGCGDISRIDVKGEDISDVDWGFKSGNTFASKGQKMIYWGPLKPLENILLRSPIAPWAYLASNLYHNDYWYRFKGRKKVDEAMRTGWGKLLETYR